MVDGAVIVTTGAGTSVWKVVWSWIWYVSWMVVWTTFHV